VGSVTEIKNESDFQAFFDASSGVIVDIRSKEDVLEHLPNAVNVDLMSQYFMEFFAELDKEKPLLVYCADGSRSKMAIPQIANMGFKKLYHLVKGLNQWDGKVLVS
jgi:rhodanese-related sulfurtransferase